MRVRILGSAAGGGFPQWNCHCHVCDAARGGVRAHARTQSSLAVRGERGPWFLLNASPDAREQLASLTERGGDLRSPPVAGILLTDAEIDHTAGLLLMRESGSPLRVFGAADVGSALHDGYPILEMLRHYCGAEWTTLELGSELELPGSSLVVERFETGGDAPLYAGPGAAATSASGLSLRDADRGATVIYAPGVARIDDDLRARLASADLVLLDGTFWRDDELARLGISRRSAADMGHVPLSGPDGTLALLSGLEGPRCVLVHINNTNPILLDDSAERAEVLRRGVRIAEDGQEFAL